MLNVTTTPPPPPVLLVADEALFLLRYTRILEKAEFAVRRARNGAAALQWLGESELRPLLVVTDLNSATSGELERYLAEWLPALPVLQIVGQPDQTERLGADDRLGYILPKPFTTGEFLRVVRTLSGARPVPDSPGRHRQSVASANSSACAHHSGSWRFNLPKMQPEPKRLPGSSITPAVG
jgi:DNA-binding response OmpR family regulator